MSVQGQSLVLAGALISIAANSVVFLGLEFFRRWALKRSAFARRLEQRDGTHIADKD
jgi:CPA2 family monovalent cation:H+ antiporter-2